MISSERDKESIAKKKANEKRFLYNLSSESIQAKLKTEPPKLIRKIIFHLKI